MRILLTGATGFLGRYVLKQLQANDVDVICLGRKEVDGVRTYIWDFKSPLPSDLPGCDCVIHLAAYPDFGQELILEQYQINVASMAPLLAYAKEHKALFLFSSAAGIHGFKGHITKDSPLELPNHYMLSKYLAEQMIEQTLSRYLILRIGGIYGIDGPDHLSLNKAIAAAYENQQKPELKGDGSAKRNYISVINMASWVVNLVQECTSHQQCSEIIYCAGDEVLSVKEYLEGISEAFGLDGIIEKEGHAGQDMIVASDQSPVQQTSFKDYLAGLHHGSTIS